MQNDIIHLNMKILIPTLEYPPIIGGISSYIHSQILNWTDKKDEFVVLAPKFINTDDVDFDRKNNWNVYRKKLYYSFLRPRWIKMCLQVWKIVKREKIDLIIVHHVLPVGHIAYYNKKYRSIPYHIYLHGTDFSFAISLESKKKKFDKICSNAEVIVVNSNYLKELVSDEFPSLKEKIKVVYPAPSIGSKQSNEEEINKAQKKYNTEQRPMLLSCGRLVERKGYDMVIKSLPQVIKKVPNLLYLICGEGEYEEKLLQLVKKNKLERNVKFIDFVPKNELPLLYSIADVFIMPSRLLKNKDIEGFGIVFLEANLMGTPVIGGKTGGMAEAIEDGVSGLLVNSTDKSDIARAIIDLLTNKKKAKLMGEQGRNRVIEDYL